MASSKTFWDARRYTILTTLAAEPTHEYSFQHSVIAQIQGRELGFCAGFPYGTPDGDDAFARAAGVRAVRAGALQLLGRPVFTALSHREPGQWYLQAIAVLPEARGAGVGRALMDDAFARASAADCTALVLDVDASNLGARRLYERLGLKVVSTSGRAVLLGGAQVHRMAVDLPNVAD